MRFLVLLVACLLAANTAAAFTFSGYEEERQRQEEEAAQQRTPQVSEACRASLKGKKVAFIVGERQQSGGFAGEGDFGGLAEEINSRLRQYGMRTFSSAEITAQIAQAERDAVLNNDLEAAASAASRLQASFFIKGIISTKERTNPVVGVQELFVTMHLTLSDAHGRTISDATASGTAFSGADTLAAALELVRENGDRLIAKIYDDYCATRAKHHGNP